MGTIRPVPQMEEVVVKSDFDRIVAKAQQVWDSLPKLDYDALHDELASLNVGLSESPSVQKIASDMIAVQGVLTRATQIRMIADRDFSVKKNIVKTLSGGWIKFSSETSQDRRKAEAEVKLWQFYEALTEAEVLYNAATSIVENLHSKYEAVSRLVSIVQIQVKLMDGSNSRVLPDATFLKKVDSGEGDSEYNGEQEGDASKDKYEGWPESP